MTAQSEKYQSISCSYYDQLEAYATRRTVCTITYSANGEQTATGVIVDLFAKEGAEYLTLDTGAVIRLDHLISINGVPVSKFC